VEDQRLRDVVVPVWLGQNFRQMKSYFLSRRIEKKKETGGRRRMKRVKNYRKTKITLPDLPIKNKQEGQTRKSTFKRQKSLYLT